MIQKAIEYSLKAEKKEFTKEKIRSSIDAAKFARKFYFDDINIYESAFVILMNRAGTAIGYAKISQGGIVGVYVDKRIIFKYAIETLATSVIFVHNHPSGNLIPSEEDKRLTESLKEGLGTLDITLLDSMILTDEGYYSFQEEGLL